MVSEGALSFSYVSLKNRKDVSEPLMHIVPVYNGSREMKSEKKRWYLSFFLVLWNMLLYSKETKGGKINSCRMRKRSKYKSIKHNYCKYCLAKCFIFLHKNTMKFAWEPATKLLNKDNFWPCRYLKLTPEGSTWAKRNREKWSWPPRRSPYLSFLCDLQLETKS